MTEQDITKLIIEQTRNIIEDKSEACPELLPNTSFLADTPMDSLDLATLLINLEMTMGKDPFRDGFKQFQTIEELAVLYV
jgi:acyl carrier protein